MEDTILIELDISQPDIPDQPKYNSQISMFGVFDGHCGDAVAVHAQRNFARYVAAR